MRKLFAIIPTCLLTIAFVTYHFVAPAEESLETDVVASAAQQQTVMDYARSIYRTIDFGNDSLSVDAFSKAYYGYLNLRAADKLENDSLLTICDFSKSSNDMRLWIIDLNNSKVVYHTYVAHGQGSGEEFATAFSDRNNSHQSSLGFYVTGATYQGKHGLSLRLNGMDKGFNTSALSRGVVVHGANYVCDDFIKCNKRLGRSWGCPAVPSELSDEIISLIKDGTCLFIYYPQPKYMAKSVWLNRKITVEGGILPVSSQLNYADIVPAKPSGESEKPVTGKRTAL